MTRLRPRNHFPASQLHTPVVRGEEEHSGFIFLGADVEMEKNFSACEKFQTTLLPYVYGLEFLAALAGNMFALSLMTVRKRRNWHSGIVLACNLAISDLLYILTFPLLIVYYSLDKHWVFGAAACKVERFLFTCNLYASIFFIMAISVNRCVALACPFFSRTYMQPAHAKALSIFIWFVVGVVSCPVLNFASVCPNVRRNKTLCVSLCGRSVEDERLHLSYNMFLAGFGCLLPFVVTLSSYCVVITVVWKNGSITTQDKRKVALLVIPGLVLYVVSFVPYHTFRNYNFYLKIQAPGAPLCWVYHLYQVSKGLVSLNMCFHPFLYMALFDNICVVCCGRDKEGLGRATRAT